MIKDKPVHYQGKHAEISAERGPQNKPFRSKLEKMIKGPASDIDYRQTKEASRKKNRLSILDAQETTSPFQPKQGYRQHFLNSCEPEYWATLEAYYKIWPEPLDRHVQSLSECREHAYFARDKATGEVKIMTDSCRQRWCPMCAGQKAKFAKESTRRWIESLEEPRFLTLTLRHCEESLKSQIEFLQDCFRRIRYRAYWKRNVTGGIWFLQVHRSESDGCWHPHFHILLDGNYMEKERISALWELVTFGSPIIKIKQVKDTDRAAEYVARYSSRPAKFVKMKKGTQEVESVMSLEDRIEMITALHGKRLSGTFGTAKTVTLTPPKIENTSEWQQIGYFDEIIEHAASDPAAKAILDAWKTEEPLTEEQFTEYTGIDLTKPDIVFKPPTVIQYNLEFFNEPGVID